MSVVTRSEIVFACHTSSCRPPTSGGTGGSSSTGGGSKAAKLNARYGTDYPHAGNPGGKTKDLNTPRAAHPSQTKRLAVGKTRTIKDDDGVTIGKISRNAKGYHTDNGHSYGTTKTLSEAVSHLKAGREGATLHNARITHHSERTPEQKAVIKNEVSADRKRVAQERLREPLVQGLTSGGKIKASDVRFRKADGAILVKGKVVELPATKYNGRDTATVSRRYNNHGQHGYIVPPHLHLDHKQPVYRTQAAAKAGIARFVNEIITSTS